jgi:hypothetical protein
MELRQEPLPGDASVTAVLYGPLVLATKLGAGPTDESSRVIHSGETVPKNLPPAEKLPEVKEAAGKDSVKTENWVQVQSSADLRFKASGASGALDLTAMYKIRDERYSVYLQTSSPKEQS